MRKIDRFGWKSGLCLTTYGVTTGIRANTAQIINLLTDYLPPGWSPSPSEDVDRLYSLVIASGEGEAEAENLLYEDEVEIARLSDLDLLLEILESKLKVHVAEMSPNRVFVHAGVAAWQGKAIVLPGRSFTGKTTLVAELVRSGASYYSDEYAVLDEEGWVHPYSVPLAVRRGSSYRQTKTSVEVYGGKVGVERGYAPVWY